MYINMKKNYLMYPRKHFLQFSTSFYKKNHMLVKVHQVVFPHTHQYKTDGLIMAEMPEHFTISSTKCVHLKLYVCQMQVVVVK
jgi:hypothetical protein